MPSLPDWLHDAPAPEGVLEGASTRVRWSLGEGTLRGRVDGEAVELEFDAPAVLKIGRARRPHSRWLGFGKRDEHVLVAELRHPGLVLNAVATSTTPELLDGLPWWDHEGPATSFDGLQQWIRSMLSMPGVELADWPDDDTLDPRRRQEEEEGEKEEGEEEEGAAGEESSPHTTTDDALLSRGLRELGATLKSVNAYWLVVCALGFGGTSLLASMAESWYVGGGAGFLVAVMSQILGSPGRGGFDSAERLGRYALWGLAILPIYGLVFVATQDQRALSTAERSSILNKKVNFIKDDFFRFEEAHVEHVLAMSVGTTAVAPLVPDGWDRVKDEASIWVVCQGDQAFFDACTTGWRAEAGTLYEAVPYEAPDPYDNEVSADAKELVSETLVQERLVQGEGGWTYLFVAHPADASLGEIKARRWFFYAFIVFLAFVWLGLERWGTLRERRKEREGRG